MLSAQVQRLLRKHSITDGAKVAKREAQAKERAALAEVYTRHAGSADYLELMVQDLPGVTSAKQVWRQGHLEALADCQH